MSLMLHGAGLIVIYSLYGVLQEKIMKGTYGAQDEHFTSSSLLILANRIFSVSVGFTILFYKSRQSPEAGTFVARCRPAHPYFAYASVAVFNFLSTTCQYQALRYVTYTTQSLAKTSKMIPVLVVGALVYKQQHKQKDWVAGGVILLGCATYLFSTPPAPSHHAVDAATTDQPWFGAAVGALLLCGYLFFDGLVSTTQERVFGKNPTSSDPFGPDSPVLDQMIWTNIFAGLIALLTALATIGTESFWTNLGLLLTSAKLMWDVCVFSAASALGLIILLNTIASFGALTSSLIMTIRQFLSILINAGVFGNFFNVSVIGWMGVFWVASGIYIKMNRSFDPPKKRANATVFDAEARDEEKGGLLDEAAAESPIIGAPQVKKSNGRRYFMQYLLPVAMPVIAALLCAPFWPTTTDATWGSYISDQAHSLLPGLSSAVADYDNSVEGGRWDDELHGAFAAQCETELESRPYKSDLRTGFVSYPRSGNSYIRSLLERATGIQTSSVYCDHSLQETFKGECDHKANFFVKTHFPAVPSHFRPSPEERAEYYKRFDQVIHVVRNPFDAVSSWWHLSHTPRHEDGSLDHEGKVELPGGKFGKYQRSSILSLAELWRDHSDYWSRVPILTYMMRYEDLKAQPIPHIMTMTSYLLPDQELPPLSTLACLAEHHENLQAYHSRRSHDFYTWDQFEPELRQEILEIVRRPFCQFGYLRMLTNAKGELPEMEGYCDGIGMSSPQPIAEDDVDAEDEDEVEMGAGDKKQRSQ